MALNIIETAKNPTLLRHPLLCKGLNKPNLLSKQLTLIGKKRVKSPTLEKRPIFDYFPSYLAELICYLTRHSFLDKGI